MLDVHTFWQQVSKEELWNEITRRWDAMSRVRVIMLLAMHHKEEMWLSDIAAQTGLNTDWLAATLKDLEDEGIVVRCGSEPPRYHIGDERKFLRYIDKLTYFISVTAGEMSILASWALK
ncbi:MAG: hypothetical protein NZT92_01910 [Abditibacteriales bacterium]|nr:hypothetical protein [Abditibacteriales bacterium]MDW8364639.1 hypothetical protein [Abditibacteriales bacterium]